MSETTNEDRSDEYRFNNSAYLEQLPPGEDVEFSKYLLDRMNQLESRNTYLKEQCDQIESEKRLVESQKLKYEREVRKLRSEIDKLKTVPLVMAEIVDVIDDDRIIVRSSTGPQFLVGFSQFIDADLLVPGSKVALNQQSLSVVDVIPRSEEPFVSAMEVLESQEVDYSSIGGLDEQIQEIIETVELPIKKPEAFSRIGITPPKGVLLFGPPGTGKTLLAKAVAHRTEATFIRVVGSELVQKYIGDGSRLVRGIFEMARKKAPTILFIDELDAIAAIRLNDTNGADREVQRTLMQLLAEMDGFSNRGEVRIIAATNRVDVLDPAIVRPGRFDRMISIPMPDEQGRHTILNIHTQDLSLSEDVDLAQVARLAGNASGADLYAIVMEAGMKAVRNNRESIFMSDLKDSVDKVLGSRNNVADEGSSSMFC